MPKLIEGATFYSIPEAAKEAGVARNTMFRWVVREIGKGASGPIRRDVRSGHYLVSEDFVRKNRLANRYVFV